MIRTYRDALLGARQFSYKQALMAGMSPRLSPSAAPFHPIMGEDVNNVIFNNGLPTLTVQSGEHEFLKGFSDETLDECFPPSAADAAELEVCEMFVAILANLDFLESKEEATRMVHAGLRKRWEARRELVGRPKKETRHLLEKVIHGGPTKMPKDLVIYDHSSTILEHRMSAKQRLRMQKARVQKKQRAFFKAARRIRTPIHQPRKHY